AALASSLATVALLALPGTVIHLLLGHIDWQLTAWLALGVFPSTYLGSRLALRLPTQLLGKLYGLFLVILALYFAYTEVTV
ncbi:MAG: sulfite exporter TauE/SafE family protein, partial [Gemmatimonadaceae bacterium]|nr:sulfite exporter TauE/SafE family protein [Gloeobacterales cyanobacterium ES-bin-141]